MYFIYRNNCGDIMLSLFQRQTTNFLPITEVIFGAGIYAGVYVEQNYEIPKSWDAKSLWEKFQEFTEKYKRDK